MSTLLRPWSSATFHSFAAAAFVTSKLLPERDLDVAPQQQLPVPPEPVRTLPGLLTALAASLDSSHVLDFSGSHGS